MKTTRESNIQLNFGGTALSLDQILVYLIFLLCCLYSFFEHPEILNGIVGVSQ
ncbi:MAG: hypothetical protein R2879_00480 [Saprospiraceae bacterium]